VVVVRRRRSVHPIVHDGVVVVMVVMGVRPVVGQVARRRVHDGERYLKRHGHDPVRRRRGENHDEGAYEPGQEPTAHAASCPRATVRRIRQMPSVDGVRSVALSLRSPARTR
jgi:hypothetical protein